VCDRVALLAEFVCARVLDAERGKDVLAGLATDLGQLRVAVDHSYRETGLPPGRPGSPPRSGGPRRPRRQPPGRRSCGRAPRLRGAPRSSRLEPVDQLAGRGQTIVDHRPNRDLTSNRLVLTLKDTSPGSHINEGIGAGAVGDVDFPQEVTRDPPRPRARARRAPPRRSRIATVGTDQPLAEVDGGRNVAGLCHDRPCLAACHSASTTGGTCGSIRRSRPTWSAARLPRSISR
jgi:hypothetical protein